MASVTSLDQDMRRLRMDRVTPQAEEEVRTFIQASLKTDPQETNPQKRARDKEIDERLLMKIEKEGLFDFLGDGVALCRYVYIIQSPMRLLLMSLVQTCRKSRIQPSEILIQHDKAVPDTREHRDICDSV